MTHRASCYPYAVRLGALIIILLAGCATTHAERGAASGNKQVDLLAVYDDLEQRIQAGAATEDDRIYAHEQAQSTDDGTAGWAFARAAIAGRLAEQRGLSAPGLVREAETYARLSLQRDPEFRRGIARRLLGSLYAQADGYVEHGDSEDGLELLREQVLRYPDDPANHLRLGEAYVVLGDPEAAHEPLCVAKSRRTGLDPRDRELVEDLVQSEKIECPP